MALDLRPGTSYSLVVRCHAELLDDEEVSLSDLEFVVPASFDEFEEVALDDLVFVGSGQFEWATDTVLVFRDPSRAGRSGPHHRVFRESEIVSVEPAPDG